MEKPDYSFTQFVIVNESTFLQLSEAGQIPEDSVMKE